MSHDHDLPEAEHVPPFLAAIADLWEYGSQMPLVMSGPFAPLMMRTDLQPADLVALVGSFARMPLEIAEGSLKGAAEAVANCPPRT